MAFIGALLFLVVILSDQKNGFNPELSLWKKILGWILLVVGILNVFLIFAKSGLNVSSSYNNQGISFCAVFIGWGIYTLRSTKIHSPLWKKIYKSIVYGLMTFFTFGCGNYHFDTAVTSLIIEIILTTATFVIQFLDVKIYNYRVKKNLKEEERIVPPLTSYMQVSDIALSTPENDTFKIIKNQEEIDSNMKPDKEIKLSLEGKENKDNHSNQEFGRENSIYCRYCGREIELDSRFCKYCGSIQNYNIINSEDKNKTKKLKRISDDETREVSFFRNKWMILLCVFLILLISVVITYFCLLKYEKERWLNDSYTAAIIISSSAIGVFFIICFIWNKQKKNYYKWRNFLMYSCVCLVIVSGLASAICMLDTLFSSRFKEAKNIYNQNQALQSNNEDILNQELNRRFENFWNIKSYRKGESYNTLEYLMKNDADFFNKLQEKSETGNGVAQGILGEYYFSLGNHQIIESKNDYNRIINESKYESGHDNINRAFYWWKRASENGDARGLYRMGNCYANIIKIEGIFKDLNMAYQFWTRASEKGYGMAFFRLGDLFGTWEYLDGTYHNISTGEVSGISEFIDQDGKEKYYHFNLPENWQHNIPLARKYWEKAVQYGGTTAELARKRLEKVYWEEQYQ